MVVALGLTACVNDEYEGGTAAGGGGNISFNNSVAPFTRAGKTGAEAANLLGKKFYVYGIKNESTTGTDDGNVVFRNYKVEYDGGTAGTSASNSSGWEYAGKSLTANEAQNLLPNVGTGPQTVKYWDEKASSYTYYAFAVANSDLEDGKVKVTKTTGHGHNLYLNGYTMAVTADADPSQIYVSCRQHIGATAIQTPAAANTYGGNVTFSFRNAMAKVRVGMYETIPGYSVTIDAFRIDDHAAPVFGQMTTPVTDRFAANLQGNKPGSKAGTLTVVYHDNNTADENVPEVTFDAEDSSKDNVLYLGTNLKATTGLKSSASGAVYDTEGGAFTSVYPMEGNLNNLKLKVDFTLSSKTGETIKVTDATAEIPAVHLRWRPGYAYTYIFKISDQTNATIGRLTGLHPITLDAVAVEDTEGKELISTITEDNNNIVTIGYDPATKTVTTGLDDYSTGNTVYASFIIDNALAVPSSSNVHLYTVTTDDPDNYPITESAVNDYISSYLSDASLVDQHVTVYKVDVADDDYVTEVPMGNGTDEMQALNAVKWTAARNIYAVEYASATKKIYKIVKIDGYDGKTEGSLALSTNAVTNLGATITPTLAMDGVVQPNDKVTYTLGAATPPTVTVVNNGSADVAVSVPAGTTPGTYTVIATCNRRTYRATFTVSQ